MPLSWNEIKSRAVAFSKEWELESNEDAEAKSFWDDFFDVFGISRRRVATFEQLVKKIDDNQGCQPSKGWQPFKAKQPFNFQCRSQPRRFKRP